MERGGGGGDGGGGGGCRLRGWMGIREGLEDGIGM